MKKKSLKEYFDLAKELENRGQTIDSDLLKVKLGASVCEASCLLFMLNRGGYFKDLESLSKMKEFPNLKEKKEGKDKFIAFTENMPPYKTNIFYGEEITDQDKEQYVSIGVARYLTFEEVRQLIITLYWGINELLRQSKNNFIKELEAGNAQYFKDFYKEKDKEYILKDLKRTKLKDAQVESILKLLEI